MCTRAIACSPVLIKVIINCSWFSILNIRLFSVELSSISKKWFLVSLLIDFVFTMPSSLVKLHSIFFRISSWSLYIFNLNIVLTRVSNSIGLTGLIKISSVLLLKSCLALYESKSVVIIIGMFFVSGVFFNIWATLSPL